MGNKRHRFDGSPDAPGPDLGPSTTRSKERAAKGYERDRRGNSSIPRKNSNGMDLDLVSRYFIEWKPLRQGHAGILRLEDDQLQGPVGREDGPLLAQHPLHIRQQDAKLPHPLSAVGNVPQVRHGQLPGHSDRNLQRPRDDLLSGQLPESQGRYQRELRARNCWSCFSLGVGMDGKFNYTEDDVKECARAFTGWTITNNIPGQPYGRYEAQFHLQRG